MEKDLTRVISERFAHKHCVYPISIDKDTLTVQMKNFDPEIIEELRKISKREVVVRQEKEAVIREKIEKDYAETEVDDGGDILDNLLEEAIEKEASDVHIEPFSSQLRIRMRLHGDLRRTRTFSMEEYAPLATIAKLRAGCSITEKRLPQDGRFTFKEVDIRLSTIPTVNGEKIVMRLLDRRKFLKSREELGFSNMANEKIDRLIANRAGIILITGATGSGKSSTVYSIINELNKKDINITTIEDPVECNIEGINQIQVNTKAGVDFNKALIAVLRQDPDCIVLGEIRDVDTAKTAIRAAITGHLVIATLHTNDAISSMMRLCDMGIEKYLISASLVGVIAQRLVKKKVISSRAIGEERTLIYEIVEVDRDLKQGLQDGKSDMELRNIALRNGMVSFEDSISEKRDIL